MTMPFERTRSVSQAHAFLTELARDTEVPTRVRHNAQFLLRHFPTKHDVLQAGRFEEQAKKWRWVHSAPFFAPQLRVHENETDPAHQPLHVA